MCKNLLLLFSDINYEKSWNVITSLHREKKRNYEHEVGCEEVEPLSVQKLMVTIKNQIKIEKKQW